jgi:hypothetical protein
MRAKFAQISSSSANSFIDPEGYTNYIAGRE